MGSAVLAGAALLSFLAAAPPARSHVSQVTHDQCLLTAAAPKNPWALSHGITALGPHYLAEDGRTAATVIIHDFLLAAPAVDGGPVKGPRFGFVPYDRDGTPVQPHPNLIAKTLLGAGVPLSTRYDTSFGQKVSLQDLVDTARGSYRTPSTEASWSALAWTLDVISATSKPGGTLTLDDGTTLKVDQVMDDAFAALERADADLAQGLAKGLPQVDKRKQGIYAHPCGGLHFLQAVFSWARFPEVKKRWGARLDAQVAVLFYRLDSERRQYEAVLQQAPQYKLNLLVQELKFYGHFLETTARLKKDTGWKPTELQANGVRQATALLDAAVRELEAEKAFERMPQLAQNQKQLYLDLIGDSCHAAHGLDGWP